MPSSVKKKYISQEIYKYVQGSSSFVKSGEFLEIDMLSEVCMHEPGRLTTRSGVTKDRRWLCPKLWQLIFHLLIYSILLLTDYYSYLSFYVS